LDGSVLRSPQRPTPTQPHTHKPPYSSTTTAEEWVAAAARWAMEEVGKVQERECVLSVGTAVGIVEVAEGRRFGSQGWWMRCA